MRRKFMKAVITKAGIETRAIEGDGGRTTR